MNGISNVTCLLLVLTVSIENNLVLVILIDDESSCDVTYVNIFTKLQLCGLDLVPYE